MTGVPLEAHPRPQLRRERGESLDGEGEFGAGDDPVFDRAIVVPFCPESPLSGIGGRVGDVLWYRTLFDAPTGESLILHFGAVDYWATVWVNDIEVARHEGGHTPFAADITPAIRPRRNVLVVRAEDRLGDKTLPRGKQHWTEKPEGIFYTATTGIWQPVWLEPVPARRIKGLRLKPDREAGAVEFEVLGDGPVDVAVRLDGTVVGESRGPRTGRIKLAAVEAWSPESPRLYEVEARLLDDRVDSYFGLRSVETREGYWMLNGEPYVQRLVLDQGYFAGGLLTAPDGHAFRKDIELAKAMGFNGARKHQKVEEPRWLYWADRLGFLVWAEMPSFHEHSPEAELRLEKEWKEVVKRDRSHPCVVTWVPANESFGLEEVAANVRSRFTARLRDITRELDSTLPVVTNDGWEHSTSDLCTVHDYSPPAALARRFRNVDGAIDGSATGHSVYDPGYKYADEPVIVSEFGGLRISGPGGWGWLEVAGKEEFVVAYRDLVDALMQPGPVEGFCYTQLADVQQEQNGLMTADREPKVDPATLHALTTIPKRR